VGCPGMTGPSHRDFNFSNNVKWQIKKLIVCKMDDIFEMITGKRIFLYVNYFYDKHFYYV
jgi:hypothetical protein